MRYKNCRASDDKLKLSKANEWEIWIDTKQKEFEEKKFKKKTDVSHYVQKDF